ncbi:DUF1775 domain-containing protein [Streptomyces asoensis]|uniref:DUF1775 domain-containing protein n=1 Tax=Streptomyces asoensis TaxID=249586 RepID=UPI003D9DBFAE
MSTPLSARPSARTGRGPRSVRTAGRTGRRLVVTAAVALTAALALAAPAAAHAEVEADKPQALAENVTLRFVSEAESDSAGFTALRVVLPRGITPADVSLGAAPRGWKLTATEDGYTVAGPALKAGVDAEHEIRVRQLPSAKEIAFKTVETYSDGEVSRWIEVPSGGEEPEQPAPVLKLKAAAPGARPVGATPSPSPTATVGADAGAAAAPTRSVAAAPKTSAAADEAAADEGGGISTGALVGVIVVALLVLGGGALWVLRRRAVSSDAG